ncbi:hypothetical protein a10_04714 [Streptomyces acidiscabies]|nr:hypothetical protein a10_04714 [Streptomyces acidiscabies]GAV46228.1 hypothetical protein Saa2_09230 [Streptomyces acidiscabies]
MLPDPIAELPPQAQVSPRVDQALRAAMERLLTGKPQRTDGRLIKDNLWKEAQVSRATMNRAVSILREWEARTAEAGARISGETRRDAELAELRARLKASLDANRTLKAQTDAAATVIATLHADNAALRDQLARRGDVISLDARRPLPTQNEGKLEGPS